jgi:hypothetical protein
MERESHKFSGDVKRRFLYGDYLMGKRFLEQDQPYAILLIGAKTSPSPLAWDCGVCGFPTCAEFNRFSNENKSAGAFGYGPACNWLMMDFGIALAQASAATFAYHFGAFSGDGIPMIKNTDDWFWEPFKAGHGPMPEAGEILPQILEKAGEVTLEYEQWLQERAAEKGES